MNATSMQDRSDIHQWAWELLPWLANGTLGETERGEVQQHLDTCTECQAELARCHTLASTVAESSASDWQPSNAHMASLLAKVSAAPSSQPQTLSQTQTLRALRRRKIPFWQRWMEEFGSLARVVRWTLALETGLIAALLLILIAPRGPQTAIYETLSSAPSQSPAAGPSSRLRVVFRGDTMLGELRQILNEVQGQIVQGPSDIGVLTLALPVNKKHPEDSLRKALEKLRASPKVVLAEPVPSS
jgi:hypothetical protein